ncbi:hypothetical protein PG984_006980 [Apiospora sp. TS-2023a]
MSAYGIFTTRERELMIGGWHTVDFGKVKVNHEKVMDLGNFETLKTATNRWGDGKAKVVKAIKDGKVAQLNDLTKPEATAMCLAWQCVEGMAPNTKKMVELGITKTEKTAANKWGLIKKKFGLKPADTNDGAADISTPGAASTPAKTPKSKKSTGTKRKAAGEDVSETPTKRTKRAAAPTKLTIDDDDAADSNVPGEEEDDAVLALAAEEQVLQESEA